MLKAQIKEITHYVQTKFFNLLRLVFLSKIVLTFLQMHRRERLLEKSLATLEHDEIKGEKSVER